MNKRNPCHPAGAGDENTTDKSQRVQQFWCHCQWHWVRRDQGRAGVEARLEHGGGRAVQGKPAESHGRVLAMAMALCLLCSVQLPCQLQAGTGIYWSSFPALRKGHCWPGRTIVYIFPFSTQRCSDCSLEHSFGTCSPLLILAWEPESTGTCFLSQAHSSLHIAFPKSWAESKEEEGHQIELPNRNVPQHVLS